MTDAFTAAICGKCMCLPCRCDPVWTIPNSNKAVKCPVCEGSGQYTPVSDGPSTVLIPTPQTCHGCDGQGWVICMTRKLTKEQEAVIERARQSDAVCYPCEGDKEFVMTQAQADRRDLLAIVKALREENSPLPTGSKEAFAGTIAKRDLDTIQRLQQQVSEFNRTFEDNVHAISLLKAQVAKQQAELESLRALLRKVADGASGFGVAEEIEKVKK